VRRAIRRRLPNSAALTCAGFKTKKGNILAGSHYSKHGTELGLYRIFAVWALMRLPSLEKPGGAVRGRASSESATSSSSTPPSLANQVSCQSVCPVARWRGEPEAPRLRAGCNRPHSPCGVSDRKLRESPRRNRARGRASISGSRAVERLQGPLQQLEADAQFLARRLLTEQFQRSGEQAIILVERFGRFCRIEFRCARKTREEHCIGNSLRVGIRKPGIVGVGKEKLPPFVRKKFDRCAFSAKCGFDLKTKEAGERREIFGQLDQLVGDRRLPP
jgi:hypothetical protein